MESSFFSSIALWFGRNKVFSRLSSKCQAHETQLYRGCFWEDVSVHANISSLGLNGIQTVAILLNAPNFKRASRMWPSTQTSTKFCTINCSSSCLLSLVELGLLLTSSSV